MTKPRTHIIQAVVSFQLPVGGGRPRHLDGGIILRTCAMAAASGSESA